MNIVVLGAGRVGGSITRYLLLEENEITIVDQDEGLLRELSNKFDIRPVVGFASHPDILKKAKVDEADLLISVTSSDEVNIVACHMAHTLFQVPTKIARLRHKSYLECIPTFAPMIDHVISPEFEVSKALQRSIEIPGTFDILSLSTPHVQVLGIQILEHFPCLNTPLRLIPTFRLDIPFVILNLVRDGVEHGITKETQLLAGDHAYLLLKTSDITSFLEQFLKRSPLEQRQIVIIGGGNVGVSFAQDIQNLEFTKIHIIEKDLERSQRAAEYLTNVDVLHADALESEIFKEISIENSDLVISVTDDDKVNILSGLLAKKNGAKRAVVLLNNTRHASLVTSLGVDTIINPHSITVSTILQSIRKGAILSSHVLPLENYEILEIRISDRTHLIGLSIEDLYVSGRMTIAVLIRGETIVFLPKNMILSVDDILIFSIHKELIPKIERLFVR